MKTKKKKQAVKLNNNRKWYFYRFRIKQDLLQNPRWWIDIVLIDRIFRIIVAHNRALSEKFLWRFHRRSGRVGAGHQVSLCCYFKQQDSELTSKLINEMAIFKMLSESGLLKEFFCEEGGDGVEGSGDGSWDREIQKSWPYFIQGVSESILKMIEVIIDDLDTSIVFDNLLNIEDFYKAVSEKLDYIWLNQGSHAFLHHLNALFGYKPIRTTQTVITSF